MLLLVILQQADSALKSKSDLNPQSRILDGIGPCASETCINIMYSPPPLQDLTSSGSEIYDQIMNKFSSLNARRTKAAPLKMEKALNGVYL